MNTHRVAGILARIIFFVALISAPACALAQEQVLQPASQKLRVATRVIPPFVIKDGDDYTGFSAMLMRQLAVAEGIEFEWKTYSNVKEILAAVEHGEADAGIAAISITADREARFDFSQPMFESGLQVMVAEASSGGFGWRYVKRILSAGALPYMIFLLGCLVLIPAHVVWLAERKHGNPLFATNYIPGIFHAIWWATGAAAGQQPDIPRSGLGRFFSGIAILVSVIFMAFFTAALTASFTIGELQGSVQGIGDLPGKRVVTVTGSTSAEYLKNRDIEPAEADKIEDALKLLEAGKADAIVYDAPVLLYHAATDGRGKVKVVGSMFRRENYGILFPRGSVLRKRFNAQLLKMREDGSYDQLRERWFREE